MWFGRTRTVRPFPPNVRPNSSAEPQSKKRQFAGQKLAKRNENLEGNGEKNIMICKHTSRLLCTL